jgi:PAS domain S-box
MFSNKVNHKETNSEKLNEAQVNMSESEFLLRAQFEHANIGIAFQSTDGKWLKVNSKLCYILGYSRRELLSMSWREITHLDDLKKSEESWRRMFYGEFDNYKLYKRFIKKDGSILYVDLATSCYRNEVGVIQYVMVYYKDVTKDKLHEQIIHDNEEQIRVLFEYAIAGITYSDAQGKYIMCNQAFADIVSYSVDELKYINFRKLTVEEDLIKEEVLLKEIIERKRDSYRIEKRYYTKSGDVVWVDLSISTIRNQDGSPKSFVSTAIDITNRKKTEEELEIFFNTAVDFMSITGFDGYFKRISPEWSKKLGWTEEELLSKSFVHFVHPDDVKATKDTVKCLVNGEEVIGFENRYMCKDGSYRWIQWNCRGSVERNIIISSARDITEQKELQEKAQELEQTIQLENLRSEFFANISHELRTPLNIIISTLQLIKQKIEDKVIDVPNEDKLNIYLKGIKQNSYRLLRLINNIIDTTKIDSGFMNLDLQNCNIVSIVEDITLSVAQFIEVKGLTLVFDTDIEEKIMACDLDKIERIILNLLSNAVKFTENGDSIFVNIYDKNDRIVISVKDTGLGIAPDKIDIIFERFRQADKSLSRRCEGSGIGLSLVSSLVQMHDGTISVKSELGKGSEFIIELPVKLCDEKCENEDVTDMARKMQIQKCNIEFSDIYSL